MKHETDDQYPLLTHGQLVDWLIYHCPLEERQSKEYPFRLRYLSKVETVAIHTIHRTPWDAYWEIAVLIAQFPKVHREITDLYWYWTI